MRHSDLTSKVHSNRTTPTSNWDVRGSKPYRATVDGVNTIISVALSLCQLVAMG